MNLHHPSYSLDLNQAQLLHRHTFSNLQRHSSPSSSSSPIYSNPLQDDQLRYLYTGSQLQSSPYQQEVDDKTILDGNGRSYDQTTLEMKGEKRTNLKFTICKQEEQSSDSGRDEINGSNVKWMPLRIMKTMMRRDEDNLKHQPPYVHVEDETSNLMSKTSVNDNNHNDTASRVCSDCNTTKTPLWRSGPRGPKSLCNACGIRQRKARRAMAMATNGSTPSSVMRVGNGHKKTANKNTFGVQKKKSKVIKPSRDSHHHYDAHRKLWFEEFALKLSKKLTIQQVFPQEEKEAAMLLMALSCGFVHG